MGFDRARVVEVYSNDPAGERVGSGYLVGDQVVLTAGHVVAGLQCEVRPLGSALGDEDWLPAEKTDWLPAQVVWRDAAQDVALVRVVSDWRVPATSPIPRWGRLEAVREVGCMALGFPWAQARPDRVRDTEQLFGHFAPLTTSKAGRLSLNVVTSPPVAPAGGGSPWAGMSGAALFVGPYLVGVLVVDPARYGTDRLQAVPISAFSDQPDWWKWVTRRAGELVEVGPRFRLAVTQDLSLTLQPPYRPLPPGVKPADDPVRLLFPEHGVVPFLGREHLLDDLQRWCALDQSLGLRVLTGKGGAGKTRLGAELCVRLLGYGWDAGFADASAPGGQAQLELERRTMLVVDNANVQIELIAGILAQLGRQPDSPQFRLLLLVRDQGAWWEQLNTQIDGLADAYASPPITLRNGELELTEREQHRDVAEAVFATHLPPSPHSLQVLQLTNPEFANPLNLHMTILLAALGEELTDMQGISLQEKVRQGLLRRERERWALTLPGSGIDWLQ